MDYGNIVVSVAVTAGVVKVITRFLSTQTQLPKLYPILNYSWIGMAVLLIFSESLGVKFFTNYYFEILSLLVLFILYKSKENLNTRPLAIAIVPFILSLFVNDLFNVIVPKFHNHYDETFRNIRGFALMWLIGFGIYIQRQNKKEKAIRLKNNLERQILEDKKNSLEHQVAERTTELTQQKEALERTVLELKTTQNQLIQSEKLASLGELTAGIAHEIQNPLNFVNNFSEMSVELAQELNEELDKGLINKDLIKELMSDLIQNQEKISHHGKRASSIVKGMLEHSRTSTGVKELTDINALADEYLRLSYHGLRAKNKGGINDRFNADFKTDFDENLPQIGVIPQDFGRVLLNLISNAFYAVSKKELEKKESGESFKPMVIVSTKSIKNRLIIKIEDNGTGMSEATKAKIFQPFFTTKPTGEGTGLGLSLAYDIITKGHGGTIDVQSEEGKGTTFTITLLISTTQQ
jgi:two-component system, NtrC family, sensor kinase